MHLQTTHTLRFATTRTFLTDGWDWMQVLRLVKNSKQLSRVQRLILWNGPAGVFEMDNFAGGSKVIAEAIAEATKEGAFSLIGGGDSVACINKVWYG